MKNFISLGVIALSIALGMFVVKPAYENISTIQSEKATYDTALASAKQLQSIIDSLTQSYGAISDVDKAKLALILPTTFDPVKMTSDLSAAAAAQGLTINGVQIINTANSSNDRTGIVGTTTPTYDTHILSFETTGQYPAFTQFLKTVESNAELMDLSGLSIKSSKTSSTGTGQLNFDVSFNTYTMGTQ